MPTTALLHFNEDMARARAILAHAASLRHAIPSEELLRSDLLRSSWMFAVGALDAYFCDACTDVVASTIIAKSRQGTITLPEFFYEIRFPIRAILEEYDERENWRWRMAAREMMERENVLSLQTIQKLFNKFFAKGSRLFLDLLEAWICHPDAKVRLFGITTGAYSALATARDKDIARRNSLDQFENRFADIFQRRHDCIHNCDRPRRKPQRLNDPNHVLRVIQDVEFLVHRCDEQIRVGFKQFLVECGATGATVASVGY